MSRPSDEFDETELRDEFDWMYEFNSRMAERIRGDADFHSLAGYVSELEDENASLHGRIAFLEDENAKLRRLACKLHHCQKHTECVDCPYVDDPSCFFEDEFR